MLEIPLHHRARLVVERIQLLQDLVGIVQLAPAAWVRLHTSGSIHVGVGVLEVAAILFAVGAGLRDMISKPKADDSVDLTNLSMGFVLLLEWGFRTAAGRKWFSPLLLTALAGFFVAFFRPWLSERRGPRRRRMLRVDETGVHAHLSKFRHWDIRLAELRNVEVSEKYIRFHLTNGSTRELLLNRFTNGQEIRAAILAEPLLPS